jgi:RNA recognition motif-containing protein
MRDNELGDLFLPYGAVSSAKVIIDRDTNRSKGFGFVEMDDHSAAQAAIDGLNGADCGGRGLRVNEARPKENTRENSRENSRGPRRG